MVDVFKALSGSTRREILNLLKNGDMATGEIAKVRYVETFNCQTFGHIAKG